MKLLTNTIGSFLTDDEIADAVLDFALALSHQSRIELIDVPFLNDDGEVERVRMMVGWRIELAAVTDSKSRGELHDVTAAAELAARTAALRPPVARPLAHGEVWDEDWLDAF